MCLTFDCLQPQWWSRKFVKVNIQILLIVIVTCLLTSIIHDQVKEENLPGLDCASIKDVEDLSNVVSGKSQVLFS